MQFKNADLLAKANLAQASVVIRESKCNNCVASNPYMRLFRTRFGVQKLHVFLTNPGGGSPQS